MLQSDTLANEFNDILNGVEIFAPFQPLDPAVTFYAPLRTTVRDLRLNQDDFQRNSDAWYKDGSGIYRNVGINQPRFEESRLLMEPAKTNKCEVYSFPDNLLTGYALVGEGALTRLQDEPAEFHGVGNGFCVDLDCTATDAGRVTFAGVTGNTNAHTLSAWVKKISGAGVCNLQFHAGGPAQSFANTQWERVSVYDSLTATNNVGSVYVSAGARARLFLPQLEESPVATSPIVTEGTAGQRAAEILNYANPDSWFNQSAGMAILNITPLSELLDNPTGNRSVLSISNDAANIVYHNNLEWRTYDRVQIPRVAFQRPTFDLSQWVCTRWSSGQFEIGENKNEAGWRWGTPLAFTDFHSDNIFSVIQYINYPYRISDITVYEEDKGRAWIEANYP